MMTKNNNVLKIVLCVLIMNMSGLLNAAQAQQPGYNWWKIGAGFCGIATALTAYWAAKPTKGSDKELKAVNETRKAVVETRKAVDENRKHVIACQEEIENIRQSDFYTSSRDFHMWDHYQKTAKGHLESLQENYEKLGLDGQPLTKLSNNFSSYSDSYFDKRRAPDAKRKLSVSIGNVESVLKDYNDKLSTQIKSVSGLLKTYDADAVVKSSELNTSRRFRYPARLIVPSLTGLATLGCWWKAYQK